MNYICAEEFLKQPEKVQKTLIDWWKQNPQDTDLIGYIGETPIYQRKQPWIVKNVDLYCLPIGEETIPLFTERQLREFIEQHYNGKVEVEYSFNGYTIYIIDIMATDSDVNNVKEYFETRTIDLLGAYWQVVIKIAE